jgi:hypothetical protein
MSHTYKLHLHLRFQKETPHEVIDFLVNGHIYEGQSEFRWMHPEDCYEARNILLVKNQYQFTKNNRHEYRYELNACLYFKDDEMDLIFRFSTYLAQHTETEGFGGYYICTDNIANKPELLYFNGADVTAINITSGKTFTTNWINRNDANI